MSALSPTEARHSESTVGVETPPEHWGLLQKTGFRLLFCYWVIFCLDKTGGPEVPLIGSIPGALQALSSWAAINVFGLSGSVTKWLPTGSGDTALHHIYNLWVVVFAIIAAVIWSVLDWRRPNYKTLARWLHVLLRYTLAAAMFSYGWVKVFPSQFPMPTPGALATPLGDLNPHSLLWNFMGYSPGYSMFTGAAELLAGFLLIWRRTATLGAIVAAGVLSNVVALNFFYDTAVKLWSMNLLGIAVYLVARDFQRLVNVLVLNRPAQPQDLEPLARKRWARIGLGVLKIIVVLGYFMQGPQSYYRAREMRIDPGAPLYGAWDVEQFLVKGQPLAAGQNGRAWKKLTSAYGNSVFATTQEGTRRNFEVTYQTNRISFKANSDGKTSVLQFSRDGEIVNLEGPFEGEDVKIRLKSRAIPRRLIDWGWHWVKPYGYE